MANEKAVFCADLWRSTVIRIFIRVGHACNDAERETSILDLNVAKDNEVQNETFG